MAAPVSVGDAIELVKIVVKLYKIHSNANKDMEGVRDTAIQAQAIFDTIKRRPPFLRTPEGKLLNNVLGTQIQKSTEILRELETLGKIWMTALQDRYPLRRILFEYFRISGVKELHRHLDKELDNITRTLITAIAKSPGNEVNIKPEEMKTLCERAQKPISAPSAKFQPYELKDPKRRAVEEAFSECGITETQTPPLDGARQRKLRLSLAAIQGVEAEKLVAAYDNATKEATLRPPPAPVSPKPSQDLERKKKVNILIVDDLNGKRAIMAQVYLDLIRPCFAKSGIPWLLHNVHSAGINIKSTLWEGAAVSGAPKRFGHPGELAAKDAVDAMAGTSGYFSRDEDQTHKERIIKRMKAHKGQGIEAGMFIQHHYILTFSRAMKLTLEQLCSTAQKADPEAFRNKSLPKLHILPNTRIGIEPPPPPTELVNPIRDALEAFLATKFGWKGPAEVHVRRA